MKVASDFLKELDGNADESIELDEWMNYFLQTTEFEEHSITEEESDETFPESALTTNVEVVPPIIEEPIEEIDENAAFEKIYGHQKSVYDNVSKNPTPAPRSHQKIGRSMAVKRSSSSNETEKRPSEEELNEINCLVPVPLGTVQRQKSQRVMWVDES